MSNRRARWLVAGLAVLLAPIVGTFVYLNVLRDDPPERLSLEDVTTTTGASAPDASAIDGQWSVSAGSVVGYRVTETLFGQSAEAVGRSEGVTGELLIDGATVTEASFVVDMATFESDESRRDGQFEGRIMEVAEFPTATFELSAPIELGAPPEVGERVSVDAVGELTLHGVTRAVTIPLVAELGDGTFAVDGSTTVVFSDYGIDNPSGGPAQVGDEGELEVLLVFAR